MKKTPLICGMLLAGAALFVSNAQAAAVNDDFESYAAGSNLHGQGNWEGWDNTASAGANISTTFAFSGTQSVNVTGGSDLVYKFSGVNSGIWALNIRQYIPTSSTGTSYFILMNQYGGGNYNWSVQVQYNMATGQMTSDQGGGATLPFVKDTWADLGFTFDLGANTVTETYNGQVLSTHAWQSGGANALAAMDLFANGAGPVYYDNLTLVQVPEPTVPALLALGGLLLALRRNKR